MEHSSIDSFLDEPQSVDSFLDEPVAQASGDNIDTFLDEPSVIDKSKGFFNNFSLSEIKRSAEQDSAAAGIVKFLTGNTAEKVEEEKRKIGMDVDPMERYLENRAEEAYQSGGYESKNYLSAEKELDSYLESKGKGPEFSFSGFKAAVSEDIGGVAAEFAKAIIVDPELALTPLGWKRAALLAAARTAKAGKVISKTASTIAGVTGAATTGAAVVGGISAAQQLGESGKIDTVRLSKEAAIGGVISAAFGGVLNAVKPLLGAASVKTGKTVEEVTDNFTKRVQEGKSVQNAMDEVYKSMGLVDDAARASGEAKVLVQKELGENLGGRASGARNLDAPKDPAEINALAAERIGTREATKLEVNTALKARQINEQFSLRDSTLQKTRTSDLSKMAVLNESKRTGNTAIARAFGKAEGGKIDPKLAGIAAVGGLGAAVGFAEDGDPLDAAAGAALALGGAIGVRALYKVGRGSVRITKQLAKPDNRIRINALVDDWEANGATSDRASWQLQKSLEEMVPNKGRRELISHWVEGDRTIKLSSVEKQVASAFKDMTDKTFRVAKSEGVIDSFLYDYVPHFWRHGGKTSSELREVLSRKGAGMGTKTVHAKQRTIPTLKEGINAGLVPDTLDIAEIAKKYLDGVNRAIRNKRLVDALKEQIDVKGNKLIMKVDDAPSFYETIGHPQFVGQKVHPDILPSLKFVFDTTNSNVATRALLAVNMASKRSLVSLSFFHANALVESLIFAKGVAGLKDVPGLLSGKNAALQLLRNGGAGDAVDEALRVGLKIGVIEDVGADIFYAGLKDLQTVADDFIPKSSYVIKGVERASKFIDEIMWDKIATGAKLTVFMKEMEKQTLRSAKRHERNPKKYPMETREQIGKDVAEYVNDAFGGQNWRRIAEGVKSQYGRDLALAVNSPSGRKAMQLLLFAPDWTISNLRILVRAATQSTKIILKKLTGRQPTQSEMRLAKLHNMYAIRGAIFFATAGNAINLITSGNNIWENKDPTTIDLGDGRRMMFSKQFVEPYHWAATPAKTLGNKMGIMPRSVFEFITNKKWISPYGAPNIWNDDASAGEIALESAKHIGNKFVPIGAQQVRENGPQGVAGLLGHPILGKKKVRR